MGHPKECGDIGLAGDLLATCLVGRVDRVDGEEVSLILGRMTVVGRRAVSCLITLQAGDTVCLVRDDHERYYVTAVLQREICEQVELSSRIPFRIRSDSMLSFSAGTQLEVDAAEHISLRSPLVRTVVDRLTAIAKLVNVMTGEALLNSRMVSVVSHLVEMTAERIGISAKHSHRRIDGLEQIRCQHLDIHAEEMAYIKARTALIKAKDLVKTDAAQIQIG